MWSRFSSSSHYEWRKAGLTVPMMPCMGLLENQWNNLSFVCALWITLLKHFILQWHLVVASFDRRFLQKCPAIGVNIPVAIIPWGSTFGGKLENTETHSLLLAAAWCPPWAGDAQYLPNPGKSAGQSRGSPQPCIAAPHLCSLDASTRPVAIEGDVWAPVAVTGGLLATRWNPSHAWLLKLSLPKAPFRTCRNSVLLFCGFCTSGVLGLRRAQILRGKCPREDFTGSSKTWSFKTDWWKEWHEWISWILVHMKVVQQGSS